MDAEKLRIQLSKVNRLLGVQGSREPTKEEEDAMRRQIKLLKRIDTDNIYFPMDEDEQTSLLRIGAGRYGSFSQFFKIPANVNLDDIKASYVGGVLQLVLPKEKKTLKNEETAGQTAHFLDDKDLWWLDSLPQLFEVSQ